MTRWSYYFILFILIATGIVLAFVVIPTKREYADALLQDHQYSEAYRAYLKLYESGDRSLSTISTLSELALDKAKIKDAVGWFEKLVEEDPNNLELRTRLGDLYYKTNRPYLYLLNLETIFDIHPTLENLAKQRVLFKYYNDPQKEIEVLQKIIVWHSNVHEPTPFGGSILNQDQAGVPNLQDEYVELIALYASQGNFEKALETVNALLDRYPISSLKPHIVVYVVQILVNNEAGEKAYDIALSYAKDRTDVSILDDFVSIFSAKGMYQQALRLIDSIGDRVYSEPLLLQNRFYLLWEEGDSAKAYQYLKSLYLRKNLPESLVGNFVLLSLSFEKNVSLAIEALQSCSVEQIDFTTLIEIYKSAIELQEPEIAKILDRKLTQKQKEGKWYPIALAIVVGSLSEEQLLQKLIYTPLTNIEKVSLAELAFGKPYIALSKRLIQNVSSVQELNRDLIHDFVVLSVQLDLVKEAAALIDEQIASLPLQSSRLEYAKILLDTAEGKNQEVHEWLKNKKGLTPPIVRELYEIAELEHHTVLALELAEKLVELEPSLINQRILAAAYLNNGEVDKAVPIIDLLVRNQVNVGDLYLILIQDAAKQGKLDQPKYHLIFLGILADDTLSAKAKRDLAYQLVDDKREKEAAEIFLSLANNKPIDDPDVQMLLFLWEKKLDEPRIAWIYARFEAADEAEKAKWLQYLLDVEHPELAARWSKPYYQTNIRMAFIYLQALEVLKQKESIRQAIVVLIQQKQDEKLLKKFGKIARENDLKDLAIDIYEMLFARNPDDQFVLRTLGVLYFDESAYSRARNYWGAYIALYPGDYKSYFYYGEILLQCDRDKSMGRTFLLYSLSLIQAMDEPTFEACKTLAKILVDLEYDCQAIALYEMLLDQYPGNLSLREEFASYLNDFGLLELAREVLNAQPISLDESDTEIQLQLDMDRIFWFKNEINLEIAIYLGEEIQRVFPESARVYATLADVEHEIGRWHRAVRYLDYSICLKPLNESFQKTRREILNEHLSLAGFESEYRRTGHLQVDYINRLNALTHVTRRTRLLTNIEEDHLVLKDYVNLLSGDILPDTLRCTRYRGTLELAHDLTDNIIVKTALFAGKHVVGVGGSVERLDFFGNNHAFVEYKRPYWGVVDSFIHYGSRSRILLGRRHKFTKFLEAFGDCAFNQYSLPGQQNVVDSWTVDGELGFRVPYIWDIVRSLGDGAGLGLHYQLSAEYVISSKEEIASDGTEFEELPIMTQEVHSFYMSFEKKICWDFRIEGFAGGSYDRFGSNPMVPIGSITGFAGGKPGFEIYLNFSHLVSSQQTSEMVDSAIIGITYFY